MINRHEIISIKSELLSYEVGKDGVAKIEKTLHGNEKTTVYKITNDQGELIVYAGLLVPHEVKI